MFTYTMLRQSLLCASMLCFSVFSTAQSTNRDVELEKAKILVADNKLDDADKALVSLLKDEPTYGEGWDLLTDIRHQQYQNSKSTNAMLGGKSLFSGNFTITTTDKDGKVVKGGNDSLAQELRAMLTSIDPVKRAFSKFNYTARKATMLTRTAFGASAYLRIYNVDLEIDTNLNEQALKYFNDAEKEFEDKNFNKAANLYRQAIEQQPDFYKARMYLGDCYYFMNIYNEAVTAFKASRDKFPFLLEPRKYLTDCYWKLTAYDKATEEAINSMTVYPDYIMMAKMENMAYMDHHNVSIKWTARGVLPNRLKRKEGFNDYSEAGDDVTTGPWTSYVAAGDAISSYCDSSGMIVKANSLTTSPYMEVYSWEQMLKKNPDDKSLDEARKMQKQGYLDCYVLVSCFHYDIYQQYHHFATNNKEKIIAYFKAFNLPR